MTGTYTLPETLAAKMGELFNSKIDALKGTQQQAIKDALHELSLLKVGMPLPEVLPTPKREGWAEGLVAEALFGGEETQEQPFHRAVRVIDEAFSALDKAATPKTPHTNAAAIAERANIAEIHNAFKDAVKSVAMVEFASDKPVLAY